MVDDPLKLWFSDEEDNDSELNKEEQEKQYQLMGQYYRFAHLSDPAEIACYAEHDGSFNKQSFITKLGQLSAAEFKLFCIKLIQHQAFHESIMGCAGTEDEQYIPDHLKKDFVIKKKCDNELPLLKESLHNKTSAGVIAQKSKLPNGYCKTAFIDSINNMSDGDFQKMCGDIKQFSWQNHFLSHELYTDKPFAIPPKLRSHFWINGIDEEHFFVYEQFPQHPDHTFIRRHSNTFDDFVHAIKAMPQHQFHSLCKNVIQSHYFAYNVSGKVGTDLPERIPKQLTDHFSKMNLDENEVPQLQPRHSGGLLLRTRPGFIFQECATGEAYSKTTLIYKAKSMSPEQFNQFSFEAGFVIDLHFSYKDWLFTCAFHAIPTVLRMYFRYFDIRDCVFTQRLDKYLG
jgi:hypothetical protein